MYHLINSLEFKGGKCMICIFCVQYILKYFHLCNHGIIHGKEVNHFFFLKNTFFFVFRDLFTQMTTLSVISSTGLACILVKPSVPGAGQWRNL